MVIFHSYVKLPEGKSIWICGYHPHPDTKEPVTRRLGIFPWKHAGQWDHDPKWGWTVENGSRKLQQMLIPRIFFRNVSLHTILETLLHHDTNHRYPPKRYHRVSGLFPHSFQVSNLSWGAVWCCTCYFKPEAIISNLGIENPPVFIGKHGHNVAESHKTS